MVLCVSKGLRRTALGYALAAVAPPLVTAVVLSQHPTGGSSAGYAYLYLGTVTLVALFFGLGPALLAAVLSAGLLDYYLVAPVGRLSIGSVQDLGNLALFIVAATVVGLLAVARQRQEQRAYRLAESLQRSNRELERKREEAEEGRRAGVELARVSARVDALAEADRLKSELLANVSHELRTPLGAIVGMSSALSDPTTAADSEQVRQYADTIHNEGQHLARLVGDLLEMASLEAGSAAGLQLEAVDALEALESAAERAQYLDPAAHMTVTGEHFLVLADDGSLQGVLRNLLENAARHGAPIDLACRPLAGVGVFEVADRGPGVPAGETEAIFERFHQVRPADEGERHLQAGSGLGLAICKRLVEGMGGRIWYSDRPGGGALFTFEIPLYEAEPPGER
jgi:K+-sensing histidine kinase KdpD